MGGEARDGKEGRLKRTLSDIFLARRSSTNREGGQLGHSLISAVTTSFLGCIAPLATEFERCACLCMHACALHTVCTVCACPAYAELEPCTRAQTDSLRPPHTHDLPAHPSPPHAHLTPPGPAPLLTPAWHRSLCSRGAGTVATATCGGVGGVGAWEAWGREAMGPGAVGARRGRVGGRGRVGVWVHVWGEAPTP